MKTTNNYLDDVKIIMKFESDTELAKWLDITKSAISNYRHGSRTIDDYMAVKIAEAIGENPLTIIAIANMERERDEGRKRFWENFSRGMARSAVFVLSLLGLLIGDGVTNQGFASDLLSVRFDSLYIMRNNNGCLDSEAIRHK